MIPYQKEKAHEDEYGHCGHGHRVWHQAGDVVVHGIQGFQEHLFPEALLCFRKRDRRGERQRLFRAQMCSGTSQPLWGSHKGANQLWTWLYSKGCLVLAGTSQASTDMKQTLVCLGITKVFWPWCRGIVWDILADRPFISDIDSAGQHWGLLLANLNQNTRN